MLIQVGDVGGLAALEQHLIKCRGGHASVCVDLASLVDEAEQKLYLASFCPKTPQTA